MNQVEKHASAARVQRFVRRRRLEMPLSPVAFCSGIAGNCQNTNCSVERDCRHNSDFSPLISGDANIAIRGRKAGKLVGPKFVSARRQVNLEFAVIVRHSFEGGSRVLNCYLYLWYRHSRRVEDRPLEPRRRLLRQNETRAKRQRNKR